MAKPTRYSLKRPKSILLQEILRERFAWQTSKRIALMTIFILTALILAACSEGDRNHPTAVVEDYLQAKVSRDAETLQKLLCSEMETFLEREIHTFETVSEARIEDLGCTWHETQSVVQCQGRIVASYGAEKTEFPLESYRVVEEDGQWKWCGESR